MFCSMLVVWCSACIRLTLRLAFNRPASELGRPVLQGPESKSARVTGSEHHGWNLLLLTSSYSLVSQLMAVGCRLSPAMPAMGTRYDGKQIACLRIRGYAYQNMRGPKQRRVCATRDRVELEFALDTASVSLQGYSRDRTSLFVE